MRLVTRHHPLCLLASTRSAGTAQCPIETSRARPRAACSPIVSSHFRCRRHVPAQPPVILRAQHCMTWWRRSKCDGSSSGWASPIMPRLYLPLSVGHRVGATGAHRSGARLKNAEADTGSVSGKWCQSSRAVPWPSWWKHTTSSRRTSASARSTQHRRLATSDKAPAARSDASCTTSIPARTSSNSQWVLGRGGRRYGQTDRGVPHARMRYTNRAMCT
mmetsp:Transcript_16389/g.53388  ORF Transcript_16389/g.53388 Transcript_16389/m.53388 type:complete len:218 (-) Transcript_16389:623-1276(-)